MLRVKNMIFPALLLLLGLSPFVTITSSEQQNKRKEQSATTQTDTTTSDNAQTQQIKKARTNAYVKTNLRMVEETVEQINKRFVEYPEIFSTYTEHACSIKINATQQTIYLYGHTKPRCDNNTGRIELFSCDEKYYISACRDKTVRIWDLATQNARVLNGFNRAVSALALNEAGTILITGCEDGLLVVWDLIDNKVLGFSQQLINRIINIKFEDEYSFIVACEPGEPTIWHIEVDGITCPTLKADNEACNDLGDLIPAPSIKKEQLELYRGYWITGTPEELARAKKEFEEKENCAEERAYRKECAELALKLQEPKRRAYLVYCSNQLKDPKHNVYKKEQSWGYYLNIHNSFEAIKDLFLIHWHKITAEQQLDTILRIIGPFVGPYTEQLRIKLAQLRLFFNTSRAQYEQELVKKQKEEAELVAKRKKELEELVQQNREEEVRKYLLKKNKDTKKDTPSTSMFEKKEKNNKQNAGAMQITDQSQAEDRETQLEMLVEARNKIRQHFYKLRNDLHWRALSDTERKSLVLAAFKSIESLFWLTYDESTAEYAKKHLRVLLSKRFRNCPLSKEAVKEVTEYLNSLNVAIGEGAEVYQIKSKLIENELKKEHRTLIAELQEIDTLLRLVQSNADYTQMETIFKKALNKAFDNYAPVSSSRLIEYEITNCSKPLSALIPTHKKYIASNAIQEVPVKLMTIGDIRYRSLQARILENTIHEARLKLKENIESIRDSMRSCLANQEQMVALLKNRIPIAPLCNLILAYLNETIENTLYENSILQALGKKIEFDEPVYQVLFRSQFKAHAPEMFID